MGVPFLLRVPIPTGVTAPETVTCKAFFIVLYFL